MSIFEAIILGIVQGLTEFLPVSSTAHLRIVPALLGWDDPGSAFTAVIQIGTLAAVLWYFRHDVVRIGRGWLHGLVTRKPLDGLDARLGWMMIVGTLPIVVCGLLFEDRIDTELRSLYIIAGTLIGLALVLALAEWVVRDRQRRHLPLKDLEQITWGDAIAVGLAQAVALIPGSSRSGVTITSGLFAGMSRETAARFSFLLSLPSILAAGLYKLVKAAPELAGSRQDALALVVATVISGFVGYASIAFLLRYLKTRTTWVFILYRLALGGLLLLWLYQGRLAP